MQTLNVLNKKSNVMGTAVKLENGRVEVTENGETKTVAESTFKRWYKIESVVEVVEVENKPNVTEQQQLDELLADAEEVNTEVTEKETRQPVQHVDGVHIEQLETRGGKCTKFVTTVKYNDSIFVITEYNGYVCDVVVTTGDTVYKSPKMSIKDALENGLGLTGDEIKVARKVIVTARKLAKEQIGA